MTSATPSSRAWRVWLVCSLAGALLVALPDSDHRLFSLSERHGPGVMDLIGGALLVAGWVVLDAHIWRRRRRLVAMGRARLLLLAAAAVAGAVLIGWSVENDAGWWWLVGATVLAGAQLAAAARAVEDG